MYPILNLDPRLGNLELAHKSTQLTGKGYPPEPDIINKTII